MRVSRQAGHAHKRRCAEPSTAGPQFKQNGCSAIPALCRNLLRPPPELYHTPKLSWLLERLAVDVGLVCLPASQVPTKEHGSKHFPFFAVAGPTSPKC